MAATAVCAERRAEDASAARRKKRLDMSLIVLCCAVIAVYEVPSELFLALIERLQAEKPALGLPVAMTSLSQSAHRPARRSPTTTTTSSTLSRSRSTAR